MRTSHSGSQAGNVTESSQPGIVATPQSQQQQPEQQQHEVMTLAELQKMSAQLSGYYTGLTQGLTQEEHQAVMRFFLDGLREVCQITCPLLSQKKTDCSLSKLFHMKSLMVPDLPHKTLVVLPFVLLIMQRGMAGQVSQLMVELVDTLSHLFALKFRLVKAG